MKTIISKYGMHILALFILVVAIIKCGENVFETLGCPCRIIAKTESIKGKGVVMINSDSIEVKMLSKELYEKNIGDIVP